MFERFERFTYGIFALSRYWHKITADEMRKYKLKGPHCVYLLAMSHEPAGVTAPQLCELCGKDKSDDSRMMGILEKKGMVVKEGIYQKQYGGVFKLTEQGKEAALHVQKRASLAVELAGKDLTEAQRTAFYEALSSIAANLKKISEEGLPRP